MNSYLRVRLEAEHYAIPVTYVIEVSDFSALVPVPGSASQILGVRNVRGAIMPVIDLARMLGLRRSGVPERLVEVENDGQRAGFAVSGIESVGEITGISPERETDLLAGTVLVDGRLVGIIDVPAVFESLAGRRS